MPVEPIFHKLPSGRDLPSYMRESARQTCRHIAAEVERGRPVWSDKARHTFPAGSKLRRWDQHANVAHFSVEEPDGTCTTLVFTLAL